MTLPAVINSDDEVIFGSGPAALTYAATRVACGHAPPIVLEKRSKLGGMFVPMAQFRMNSARGASIESTRSPGPTRVPSRSPSDDLNWLPNAPEQVGNVSGCVEYPYSSDMVKAIQRGLAQVARCYTSADATFDYDGLVYTKDGVDLLGRSKRVIFAGGTVHRDVPKSPAVMSGYTFMCKPVRELEGKKIALAGSGDTAAQIAEWMFGQGVGAPSTPPSCVHWYGGEDMPRTRQRWMETYHARFAGVGRHFPEPGIVAPLLPFPERGDIAPMGATASVNGQTYDLVIAATGFRPAQAPVTATAVLRVAGMAVAKVYPAVEPVIFTVGTAAEIRASYGPVRSRFPAAASALYNQLPRVAMLAASLP